MPQVRCSYCGGRRTLARHPDSYIRTPTCRTPGCNNRRKRLKKPIRYRVDKWRLAHEVGRGAPKPCDCKMVYGKRGDYPHRKGSSTCIHNPHQER